MPEFLQSLDKYLLPVTLVVAWIAWWLGAVNWKKAWPVLAEGGWMPAVLLVVVSALVWSRMAPGSYKFSDVVMFPNFWWQLGATILLAGSALFAGWLQGYFGWAPAEVAVNPPQHGHHGHSHHDHHHPEQAHHDHQHSAPHEPRTQSHGHHDSGH